MGSVMKSATTAERMRIQNMVAKIRRITTHLKEGAYAIIFALTDKTKGSHGGITAFLVDRGTPGPGEKTTSPKKSLSSPAIIFNNVDFPEPFKPIIPILAP